MSDPPTLATTAATPSATPAAGNSPAPHNQTTGRHNG